MFFLCTTPELCRLYPRPYYDIYPLTITDRVQYYRLAYVIQKYALSVTLISFCVYHTNVPGYHNRLCNPVTGGVAPDVIVRESLAKCWRIQSDKILLKSVSYVLIESVFISLNYDMYPGVY